MVFERAGAVEIMELAELVKKFRTLEAHVAEAQVQVTWIVAVLAHILITRPGSRLRPLKTAGNQRRLLWSTGR